MKDGKITSSAAYNQILEPDNNVEPFSEFTEVKNGNDNWNNGRTYMYSGTALFQAQEGDGLQHKLSVCNDNRYVYYQFAQLLQKADMVMSSNYIFGLA